MMLLAITLNFATLAELPDRTAQLAEFTIADSPIRLALSR
jgi:hypothetical protein